MLYFEVFTRDRIKRNVASVTSAELHSVHGARGSVHATADVGRGAIVVRVGVRVGARILDGIIRFLDKS